MRALKVIGADALAELMSVQDSHPTLPTNDSLYTWAFPEYVLTQY